MSYDYRKLRGKIREICGTQEKFANCLHIGKVSLSQRLNNQLDFSQEEMHNSCDILGIERNEIPIYFFTIEVQKHEQENVD